MNSFGYDTDFEGKKITLICAFDNSGRIIINSKRHF